MGRQPALTLAALGILGGVAAADDSMKAEALAGETISAHGSHRGVAEDYLVMPSGGEISGQMRFVMSDAVIGDSPLKFTDLALFGLIARWSLFGKLELSAQADFLPKQPSATSEKPWQSVGVGLRSPLGRRAAIAISGGGGHLLNHAGVWSRESLMIEWRKPIDRELLTFDVQGGIDGSVCRRRIRNHPHSSPSSRSRRRHCSISKIMGARGWESRTRCRCKRPVAIRQPSSRSIRNRASTFIWARCSRS
jgi:hypothetical protein